MADQNTKELLAMLEKRPLKWKAEMLELYDQGAQDAEVMRALNLTVHQWRILEADVFDSIFKETVDVGRMMSKAWWEIQGRKNLHNKNFNSTLYKFMMSNNFGWSDKSETSMTQIDFHQMDDGDLIRKIREMSGRLKESRDSTTL